MNESHSLKQSRPRCYAKSLTVLDLFYPIPGLITSPGVTGRRGLLSRTQLQSGDWPYPYNRLKLLKLSVSVHTHRVSVLICSDNKGLWCACDDNHFFVGETDFCWLFQLLKPPSIKAGLAFCWIISPCFFSTCSKFSKLSTSLVPRPEEEEKRPGFSSLCMQAIAVEFLCLHILLIYFRTLVAPESTLNITLSIDLW